MGKIIVVSVYKSEAIAHLRNRKIKVEDFVLVLKASDMDGLQGTAKEVVLLSAPIGVSNDIKVLESFLLEEVPEKKPESVVNFTDPFEKKVEKVKIVESESVEKTKKEIKTEAKAEVESVFDKPSKQSSSLKKTESKAKSTKKK